MNEIEFLPEGGVVSAAGFSAGAARGEIKTEGDDVVIIAASEPVTAAAVFTRNMVKAAPVEVSAVHAAAGPVRAIVSNSGNANCCTGVQGLAAANEMCERTAAKLGCEPGEILVCSTGIIGHQLPMDKVRLGIDLVELSGDAAQNAAIAGAIMTTDTRPKHCAARGIIGGKTVTVGGCVKGAGMIGPDMGGYTGALHATMLAFLTTDAQVEAPLLQQVWETVVERTFNSVTIDGDTSTNDTAFLLASGESGVVIDESNAADFLALAQTVTTHLARQVARDGEGATHLIAITVTGAASDADAKCCAMTIANSPLVSTAIFGGDPNWGRIAMAAGRSGAIFDARRLKIVLGGIEVLRDGEPTDFELTNAEAVLKADEVVVEVDLGAGHDSWTAWTCDFSYDYVKINAEYHT